MHIFTHLKAASEGKTGLGLYPDDMVEHDDMVGRLLKRLDELGIANNTIVVYGTDNGAEVMSWPDGGSTPFRGARWRSRSRTTPGSTSGSGNSPISGRRMSTTFAPIPSSAARSRSSTESGWRTAPS